MYLLVIILDKTIDLENLVHKFRDIGVTGLTIFDSIGIGRTSLYGGGLPIIASLSRIFDSDTRTYNHTVFSVIRKKETLKQAVQVAEEVCGDFMKPDVGILFTIKLDSVIGFGTLENIIKNSAMSANGNRRTPVNDRQKGNREISRSMLPYHPLQLF